MEPEKITFGRNGVKRGRRSMKAIFSPATRTEINQHVIDYLKKGGTVTRFTPEGRPVNTDLPLEYTADQYLKENNN